MAFCGKCGNPVAGGEKYCPYCGAENSAIKETQHTKQQTNTQTNFTAEISGLNNTAESTAESDKKDITDNKVMAILAYFGPLVLIPIFAAKESKFARYHSNQGLILLLAEIAYGIVYGILSSIILAISWRLYFLVSIVGIVGIVFTVLSILGIINAAQGRAKELPIIGKYKLLK